MRNPSKGKLCCQVAPSGVFWVLKDLHGWIMCGGGAERKRSKREREGAGWAWEVKWGRVSLAERLEREDPQWVDV